MPGVAGGLPYYQRLCTEASVGAERSWRRYGRESGKGGNNELVGGGAPVGGAALGGDGNFIQLRILGRLPI